MRYSIVLIFNRCSFQCWEPVISVQECEPYPRGKFFLYCQKQRTLNIPNQSNYVLQPRAQQKQKQNSATSINQTHSFRTRVAQNTGMCQLLRAPQSSRESLLRACCIACSHITLLSPCSFVTGLSKTKMLLELIIKCLSFEIYRLPYFFFPLLNSPKP